VRLLVLSTLLLAQLLSGSTVARAAEVVLDEPTRESCVARADLSDALARAKILVAEAGAESPPGAVEVRVTGGRFSCKPSIAWIRRAHNDAGQPASSWFSLPRSFESSVGTTVCESRRHDAGSVRTELGLLPRWRRSGSTSPAVR
jgi:hypothetical protein